MTTLREGHQLGPYRIVRLLGQGGMGAVYEARQKPLERRVAIKTLHPEFAQHEEALARLFNEAKVLSRLEHPSIVQSSDFGHAPDGTPYFVMEYLRGESLAHRLSTLERRHEQLPVLVALQLAWQIADVLAVVHAQGIVHRVLFPQSRSNPQNFPEIPLAVEASWKDAQGAHRTASGSAVPRSAWPVFGTKWPGGLAPDLLCGKPFTLLPLEC